MTSKAEMGAEIPAIKIHTVNSAAESKGSIHDDEKAREMGYQGGFVPGVTVLGYMLRLLRETYGPRSMEGLEFEGRLRRPTYAGVTVEVSGKVVDRQSTDGVDWLNVELAVKDPEGVVTAKGAAKVRVPAGA